MKHQTKLNPSRIFIGKKTTIKEINAIKIDVVEQSVTEFKISNSISYILKYLDIYNYRFIPIIENSRDCFIVGIDMDLKNKKSFSIKDTSYTFYGNSILVEIPKSEDFEKLKSTKFKVENIKEKIIFNK